MNWIQSSRSKPQEVIDKNRWYREMVFRPVAEASDPIQSMIAAALVLVLLQSLSDVSPPLMAYRRRGFLQATQYPAHRRPNAARRVHRQQAAPSPQAPQPSITGSEETPALLRIEAFAPRVRQIRNRITHHADHKRYHEFKW